MELLLLTAAVLAGILASEPADGGKVTVSVDVPVRLIEDGDLLPKGVLDAALDEVDRLFASGGVRWHWRIAPTESAALPSPVVALVSVNVASRPERPVVTGCSRNRHDHRLGNTDLRAHRITLWTAQIARAVEGDWDRDPEEPPLRPLDDRVLSKAIGRVLAHELGHLFLHLDGHRDFGLMRASFSHRSLIGTSDRSFRLSDEDLERIRVVIERARPAADD